MGQIVKKKEKFTVEEYFLLEKESDMRHELVDGEVFAMVGAKKNHNWIGFNIAGELRSGLKNSGCMGSLNDQRVKVPNSENFLYPDVVVACEDAEYIEEELDTLINPTVVIEILSESTEKYDRDLKFDLYAMIDSLQEYVLVSQDKCLVELFRRDTEGWKYFKFNSMDGSLELKSIECKISISEIYHKIEFPEDQ